MMGNGRGEFVAVEQRTTFADCVILRYPMIEISSQPDCSYRLPKGGGGGSGISFDEMKYS
jgi:hypothetical protein